MGLVEQRRTYDIILYERRNMTLMDKNTNFYNLESVIALSFCKIYQFTDLNGDFSVDWSNLPRLLPNADYYAESQLNMANSPRGHTPYRLHDIDPKFKMSHGLRLWTWTDLLCRRSALMTLSI